MSFIFWIIFKAYVCSTEQILQCKYFEENKSNLAYKGPVHTIQKEFVKKKAFFIRLSLPWAQIRHVYNNHVITLLEFSSNAYPKWPMIVPSLLRLSRTCRPYWQCVFRYRQSNVRRLLPAFDCCRARDRGPWRAIIKSLCTVQTTNRVRQ